MNKAEQNNSRAEQIRAEIAKQERPLYKKLGDYLTLDRLYKAVGIFALVAVGYLLGVTDVFKNGKEYVVNSMETSAEQSNIIAADKIPPLDAEVFLVEDGATQADKDLVLSLIHI